MIYNLYLNPMKTNIASIKDLEKESSVLEPDGISRAKLREEVVEKTEAFLMQLPFGKAYNDDSHSIRLLEHPFTENGEKPSKVFEEIVASVDKPGINPASGRHLGYIPGGGLYASALADYWADITNRYSGIFFADPGAVKIENELIRWMIELVGYPNSAWGNLASGGSIANLTAIVAAREAKNVTPENIRKMVIYTSEQAHHSNFKAFKVAGLHNAVIRNLNLLENLKIDPSSFSQQIDKDKKQGLTPFLLVSSAGTTDAGIIDPIEDLSELCIANEIWHHVDAAYGGFFLLANSVSDALRSINKSDSVVLDPHKGLFLPYGLGVVLVKSRKALKDAFSYQANYMQDAAEIEEEISPAEVSPELTKHFRGLRMWIPLRLHGVKPFRAALEEKYLLAKYFYEKITTIKNFLAFNPPELSVVMFRYESNGIDSNQFNRLLIKEIHKDGRIFLSSTTINGTVWLRVAILVFRTHLETIDLTLEILEELAARVNNHLNKG